MAYTNTTRALPLGRTDRTGGWLHALRMVFARRATFNRTVRELSSLSNRELSDLGIHRSMILEVAKEAAYGRAAGKK